MRYCIACPHLQEKKEDLSAKDILDLSIIHFDIPKRLILSKLRRRELCEPRHMIMNVMLEKTRLSQVMIGKIFGRDHTSVIYAKKSVKDLCQSDPVYLSNYNRYLKYLDGV